MAQAMINVAVGFSPAATAENAGAIRTALLAHFVQLSQQFPATAIEPSVGRIALQWIPAEADEDDDSAERAEAGERRDWAGSDDDPHISMVGAPPCALSAPLTGLTLDLEDTAERRPG